MKYQIYKLKFKTGVHLGQTRLEDSEFQLFADTIFSALCQEYLKYKEENLHAFVEKFKMGRITISDAFPYIESEIYLPKPMCLLDASDKKGDSKEKKAFKKLKYIPESRLDLYLRGELDAQKEASVFRELGKRELRTHASMRGEEETRPYRVGVYHFNDGCGLYIIVGTEEEDDQYLMADLCGSLGYAGIGGKRNSGLGKFETAVMRVPDTLRRRLTSSCVSRVMTLSVSLPIENEMEDIIESADYKIIKRSGFVQSMTYSESQLRKKDLYVFQSGSCFKKIYHGDVYDVSSGAGLHPVYRYAVPMFMEV